MRAMQQPVSEGADATVRIAKFIVDARYELIPESVVHEAKRSLLNFFATAISGCTDRPIEIALRSLQHFSVGGQASIIGRRERLDALSAAFLNAASANVSDFDDTHLPTIIHPTAPIAPSLLALSELRPIAGADLILAFVLGVEVTCRMGNAIYPAHYQRGWHITATCGVFGSAVGTGKLLALDVSRMASAMAGAATQASGLVECLGHDAKSISIGNAARNGMWAALLAKDGFGGPLQPIEGRNGFFHALGESPRWAALLDHLGESWELSRNSYKPYPGGVVIHPVIDCALDLHRSSDLNLGDIQRILVRGNPLLVQRGNRPSVVTGREAQLSVQHAVAAALLFGKAGLAQFTDECVNAPATLALRAKVVVDQDAALPVEAAAVEIVTRDKRVYRAHVDAARGSARRPLSDAELEEKFFSLTRSLGTQEAGRRIVDAIWSLDRIENVADILQMVTQAAERGMAMAGGR